MTDYPILQFADSGAWEDWLRISHDTSDGVWLKIAKKASGINSVDYAGALEAALCYGWIDGQKRALDEQFWLQKFTPRRPRSVWSKVNCERVESLIAAGRMQPAGFREIESAKADGRWEAAYHSQSTAAVPDDLQAALNANPEAKAFFATISRGNRYAILYRIQDAKRPETRARRIEQFVQMLAEHRTLH